MEAMEAMKAMDRTYGFYPISTRNPFIRKLISSDAGVLVYDGYFYVDAADLPVQRIMVSYGEPVPNDKGELCYTAASAAHIEIYEKISGEDTSFRQTEQEQSEQEQEQEKSQAQDASQAQSQDASQNLSVQNQDATQSQDKDASQTEDDMSDDYDICFFPTEITTLKYRVLKSNLTSQERNMLELVIKEQTKAIENRRINEMMANLKALDD